MDSTKWASVVFVFSNDHEEWVILNDWFFIIYVFLLYYYNKIIIGNVSINFWLCLNYRCLMNCRFLENWNKCSVQHKSWRCCPFDFPSVDTPSSPEISLGYLCSELHVHKLKELIDLFSNNRAKTTSDFNTMTLLHNFFHFLI